MKYPQERKQVLLAKLVSPHQWMVKEVAAFATLNDYRRPQDFHLDLLADASLVFVHPLRLKGADTIARRLKLKRAAGVLYPSVA